MIRIKILLPEVHANGFPKNVLEKNYTWIFLWMLWEAAPNLILGGIAHVKVKVIAHQKIWVRLMREISSATATNVRRIASRRHRDGNIICHSNERRPIIIHTLFWGEEWWKNPLFDWKSPVSMGLCTQTKFGIFSNRLPREDTFSDICTCVHSI